MTNPIYLVRHAQSEANVNVHILKQKTNMSVSLTELGFQQATQTGLFLAEQLKKETKPITIWRSPYLRTRQTSDLIVQELKKANIQHNLKESIHLTERQFGLLDHTHDYEKHFEHEANHYNFHVEFEHEFFARPHLGESPFDMCLRLDFFLKSVLNHQEPHINIVVTHGAAIRGLKIMHLNKSFEEYNEPNAYNASIELLEHNISRGVIFTPDPKTK